MRVAWAIVDAGLWCAAACFAGWLRWIYQSAGISVRGTVAAGLLAGVLHLFVARRLGPYRRGQVRGSYE